MLLFFIADMRKGKLSARTVTDVGLLIPREYILNENMSLIFIMVGDLSPRQVWFDMYEW